MVVLLAIIILLGMAFAYASWEKHREEHRVFLAWLAMAARGYPRTYDSWFAEHDAN